MSTQQSSGGDPSVSTDEAARILEAFMRPSPVPTKPVKKKKDKNEGEGGKKPDPLAPPAQNSPVLGNEPAPKDKSLLMLGTVVVVFIALTGLALMLVSRSMGGDTDAPGSIATPSPIPATPVPVVAVQATPEPTTPRPTPAPTPKPTIPAVDWLKRREKLALEVAALYRAGRWRKSEAAQQQILEKLTDLEEATNHTQGVDAAEILTSVEAARRNVLAVR
jgi:hypothetical protein